ncbi:cobamide remodeling phosphodiesterase CbiR [Desulfonema magnum]|uniref:Xylose isomerase domain-containing protein n=1 Tax=Desulfonema magnum TaxID=45655 RepID=A0A975BRI7_9BACT|nr:cobamide remodeling phosphodiesterase CbiR [Desulfonema magnum]QTA89755.1 Xylose isomerase domain-containing protein [Desulfonema magnum]
MHASLPKSYKNAFPFRLGTTSFIYPDNYIPNVRMLGPYVDEIELLMFESAEEGLPSKHEIKTLSRMAEEFDLTYNVHLPTDLSLTDNDPSAAHLAVEAIQRVIDLTAPLSPSTHTLHLPYDENSQEREVVERWQETAYKNVACLLDTGISSESLSIETLDYPFEWVESIIDTFQLPICIDIGHFILYKIPFDFVYNKYYQTTSIIHLHGVKDNQDHIALNHLSEADMSLVMGILEAFSGVVSLEVFSYDNLKDSLMFLEKSWHQEKDRKT